MSVRPVIFLLLFFSCRPAFSRGGGGCFEQGTPVLIPGGVKAIDSIKPGDAVGLPGASPLAASVYSVKPGGYLELMAGPLSVRVTPSHPFAVKPGIYKEAGSLKPGDSLLTFENGSGSSRIISAIRSVKSPRPAYNLLVFPGGEYIAGGFVVHNKGCFLPDTPILRADGSATSISALRPGEILLAFNPDGTITSAKVLEVVSREAQAYYELKTALITLRATAEHPFYAGSGEFRTLKALKPGSVIYVYDGAGGLKPQKIVSIREFPGRVTVYNLRVDNPNTYFANFTAVHNKGGGCFPAGTKVMTPAGTSPIEKLSPGSAVMTFENQKLRTASVAAVIRTEGRLFEIIAAAGKTLATAEHPFLTHAGYVKASELKPGIETGFVGGGRPGWTAIKSVKPLPVTVPVYNLSVDGPNTFIADGFMVHNKGGGFHGNSSSGSGNFGFPGFITLIMAIVVTFLKKDEGGADGPDIIMDRARIQEKVGRTAGLLASISEQDRTLAPDALSARVKEVFLKLQACWTARDYAPMRNMLMPHLFVDHSDQLEGMKRCHEINVVDNIDIRAIDLIHINYPLNPDSRTFTALITALAADYYLDDSDSSFLRGNRDAAEFQEFWTFRLRAGAWLLDGIEQTAESDMLSRDNLAVQVTGTQASPAQLSGAAPEAAGTGSRIERTLNLLSVSDTMWERGRMEIAASLAFTNVYMAWQAGDTAELQPDYIMPEALRELAAIFARQKAMGLSFEFRNFCVRKAEIALVSARSGGSREDEFTARITAHALRALIRNGTDVKRDGYATPFFEFWVFCRDGGHWKLKYLLQRESGLAMSGAEKVNEEASPAQLEWYYTRNRA